MTSVPQLEPNVWDLAGMRLMQEPSPWVTAATERANFEREMALRRMGLQQTQQLHDALDAQHMQRAQQNALAELGVRGKMQQSEDVARLDREQKRLDADARKALDNAMALHGVARNGNESDDQFRARGFDQIRKNNRNEIISYDRNIDDLTKQMVRIATTAEQERAAKIERAARAALGINDQNAAVELKKKGVPEMLEQQRELLDKTMPHDSATAAELASLRNEHGRLTQAREKALEKFGNVGGSLGDIYNPTSGSPGAAPSAPRLPLPPSAGLPVPPSVGPTGPALPQDTRGIIPPAYDSLKASMGGVADLGRAAVVNPLRNASTFLFGGNYVPWDNGTGALTPDQRAMMTNNQMLFGNPNGMMMGGQPLPKDFPMPVQPVLSRDPAGGYPAMNALDLGGGQSPFNPGYIPAPQPDALQPSVNVFPPFPFMPGGQ